MKHLKTYTKEVLSSYVSKRDQEIKLGEKLAMLAPNELLSEKPQHYVLLGIPEDIGVRANNGIPGTSLAWKAFLATFCNMQYNTFAHAESVLILGEIDCSVEMSEANRLNPKDLQYLFNLGLLVEKLDEKVSHVVSQIVAAGKIPIIIGGGHNNSYGNLKGLSNAKQHPVNCINFDAHSDFRPLEHRHSGNGFSYAMEDGYLQQYYIYGLHKQYTSQLMLDRLDAVSENVHIAWFDALLNAETAKISEVQQHITQFICSNSFGLEIDLDAIASMGSSAISPIGFTVRECMAFVKKFGTHKNCNYIHLCEGAPNRALHQNQVGKTLSYLVSTIIS